MRLIDADKLRSNLVDILGDVEYRDSDDYVAGVCHSMNAVDWAPTADPVKHGHWIPCVVERRMGQMRAMRCSVCGAEEIKGSLDTNDFLKYHPHCRMCGAKLDEEEER